MAESRITSEQDTYQGVYPSVFKKIDTADVMVNSFPAYKSWSFTSGSATSSCLPLIGIYTDTTTLPAIGSELTFNDVKNIDGSLQSVTYFSINHLFYKWKSQPLNTFGPTDLNRTKKYLYQTASIFSIPQVKIGESIKPGSFTYNSPTAAKLASDRYGNLYDTEFNTASIVSGVNWYEGFNEYFDISRLTYENQNVTFIPGIPTTTNLTLPVGYAAKFNGNGYMSDNIPGYYDRDHDYSIAFFISASSTGTNNQLILAKASSSLSPTYPFKIQLSGSKQIVFTVGGSTQFSTSITSSIIVTGSWTHVVCQKSGSNLQMYINNNLHASASSVLLENTLSPFTASSRINNTDPLYIGGFSTQSSNLYGVLDEIRIFNKPLTTSNISAITNRNEGTGTFLQTQYVGNVFSKQGLVVVSSPHYRYHSVLNDPYTVNYKSTVTIHEFSTIAKLDAGDFNMSTNLTLTKDDDTTYQSFVSGSDFAPYITTIGLYNDAGELLAIGKLAQPIRKRNDVDMNFLIRIDLDKNISFKG
jgi:hypothetical protein